VLNVILLENSGPVYNQFAAGKGITRAEQGRRLELGGPLAKETVKECGTSAFYVPPAGFSAGLVSFPSREEHHIRNVLRLRPGAILEVLDGCGGRFKVILEKKHSGDGFEGRVLSAEYENPPRVRISVAIASGRRERMRIAVEKLAELGCHRIVPLLTDYVPFPVSAGKQIEKLNLVTQSALKQSHGIFLTRVENPLDFQNFMQMAGEGKIKPFFCRQKQEGEKAMPLTPPAQEGEYFLTVGPEGGFSSREITAIEESGAPFIHLGDAVLRFETAAVAGFVLLRQHLTGDLSIYGK
jgi:16S rRNA (uracil1498-N3)-methyltransferase